MGMFGRVARNGAVVLATIATALSVSVGGGAALADDPEVGPLLGNNTYRSSIDSVNAVPDVDEYVVDLLRNEAIHLTVSAAGSALVPDVELVRPGGETIRRPALPLVSQSAGRRVLLRNFPADRSGRWVVRVSGLNGSEGAYAITSSIRANRPARPFAGTLGGAAGLTAVHEFEGVAGAVVGLTLRWGRTSTAVSFASFTDPDGEEVPGASGDAYTESVARGSTQRVLSGVVLPGPGGTHRVAVAIPSGSASYSLAVSIRPPARPRGRRPTVLSGVEPRITPRTAPERTITGRRVTIAGANFSTTAAPTVHFGEAAASNVTVAAGGASLAADVPAGTAGATVALTVRNPDGQAARLAGAYVYAPLPVVTDLTTPAGTARRGGTTAGGVALRVLGSNFVDGFTVRFGPTAAAATFVDGGTLAVTTPPAAAGAVDVTVTDEFGRAATAPFQYAYKVAPAVAAANPYSPVFGAAAGGTVVTVRGTGFASDDGISVGGTVVPITFVDATTLRFTAPPSGAGTYALVVTDRHGTTSAGPDFALRAPPTITSVTILDGTFRPGTRDIAIAGGNTVRIAGTGLDLGSIARLAGVSLTPISGSATLIDFVAPAAAGPGAETLTVTDAAGQVATLANAVRRVGYVDASAARVPAPGRVDDFAARRAAVGDVDQDGSADLVLLSDIPVRRRGTRREGLRFLAGSGSALEDATDGFWPVDADADRWSGGALAIGDLDILGRSGPGVSSADVLVGGANPADVAIPEYGTHDRWVRTLHFEPPQDGYPSFVAMYDYMSPHGMSYDNTGNAVGAYDPSDFSFVTALRDSARRTPVTDIALGDVDSDGDRDIVTCSAEPREGQMYVFENTGEYDYVAFGCYYDTQLVGQPALFVSPYATQSASPVAQQIPAVRLFLNHQIQDNVEFSAVGDAGLHGQRIPAELVPDRYSHGFIGRSLELGDLDGDDDLDMVVSWDDPTTISSEGLRYGTGYFDPGVATRVLVNDGTGRFSDGTTDWMPARSGDEWWHARSSALADLDGDGDPDLVLLLHEALDAFTGTPTAARHALRILRNDGAATGFTDVTTSVLPPVSTPITLSDDFRGNALAVGDVDGDGRMDILVSTTTRASAAAQNPRRTRLLLGRSPLGFTNASGFLPLPTQDTGEADDIHLADLFGRPSPSLVLVSETAPGTSASSRFTRVFDWYR